MNARNCRVLLYLLIVISIAGFVYQSRSAALRDATGNVPTDFPNYYFAGERLFSGVPIYPGFEAYVTQQLGRTYYAYPADPPATIVLLAPLALLPYQVAWWALFSISTILIAGASALVARYYGFAWLTVATLSSLSLVTVPVLFLLQKNHMESILVALSAAGFVLFKKEKTYRAAALWGFAGALKLFPLLWLFSLARSRPAREITLGLLSFSIFSALGILLAGMQNTTAFFHDILPRSTQWSGLIGNWSLFSFGTALQGRQLGILFAAAGAVAWAISVFKNSSMPLCTHWLLGTGWAILLSPLGWINYFPLLIAPLIACSAELRNRNARPLYLLAAIIMFFWPEAVAVESPVATILLSHVPMFVLLGFLLFVPKLTSSAAV